MKKYGKILKNKEFDTFLKEEKHNKRRLLLWSEDCYCLKFFRFFLKILRGSYIFFAFFFSHH
jgi:hypothetical protein